MENEKLSGALEAILFITGDPVETKALCAALDVTPLQLAGVVERLQKKYNGGSGIQLLSFGGSVQLCSNPAYREEVEAMLNPVQRKTLSQASLEVLSIIAYKQPITRAEIEEIRGVKCDYSVMWLLQKGLIEEVGCKETIGRPMLFGTTDLFLRHFGLSSISELPEQSLPMEDPIEETQ